MTYSKPMKYMRNSDTMELVLIPEGQSHDSFGYRWTSAGFVNLEIKDNKLVPHCFGYSHSLAIGIAPDDEDAIYVQLNELY